STESETRHLRVSQRRPLRHRLLRRKARARPIRWQAASLPDSANRIRYRQRHALAVRLYALRPERPHGQRDLPAHWRRHRRILSDPVHRHGRPESRPFRDDDEPRQHSFGLPSMGSWITYGLGTANQNLPGFIVLASNAAGDGGTNRWGSAFLPA